MQSPSSQPFKTCPNCQQRLALHMTHCGRCGVAQGVPTAPRAAAAFPPQAVSMPVPSATPLPAVPLIIPCVTCSNADVQKVTAIYQSGSWTSSSNSLSVGGGHVWGGPNFTTVGTTSTKGQGVTGIAALLAPPVLPQPSTSCLAPASIGCMVPFGALLGFGFMSTLSDKDGPNFAPLIFALLCIGGGLTIFFSETKNDKIRRSEHLQHEAQWRQAMALWETLLYCARCDSVYLPHTRHAAPSRQMHGLIGF